MTRPEGPRSPFTSPALNRTRSRCDEPPGWASPCLTPTSMARRRRGSGGGGEVAARAGSRRPRAGTWAPGGPGRAGTAHAGRPPDQEQHPRAVPARSFGHQTQRSGQKPGCSCGEGGIAGRCPGAWCARRERRPPPGGGPTRRATGVGRRVPPSCPDGLEAEGIAISSRVARSRQRDASARPLHAAEG